MSETHLFKPIGVKHVRKAGLGGLMKQAQQMQENMKKAQAKLAETEVEGEAGNGLVKSCDDVFARCPQT